MLALDELMDFSLPPELEAHEPPEARGLKRDQVRLLVSNRQTDAVSHARFDELPRFLEPGDLLVANDSGTLPAELTARRADGEPFPLRLSTRIGEQLWVVEPRQVAVAAGEVLRLPSGGEAVPIGPYSGSARLWTAELRLPAPPVRYLLRWGRPIRYSYVPRPWPLAMYQTVYHRELGSAEMPSAGRPFSQKVIELLRGHGVGFVTLTLHTGVASLESHELPYPEHYRVPEETVRAIEDAKRSGGRVIAVGTTVVRALESAADADGRLRAGEAWTDLVVTPARGIHVADGLLTGFHEPRATHLAMLEALAPRAHLCRAYRAALDERYLWHEFGDVHLLL
jgi:S-adenosylmethionine:tRNA ribosyltransferase-isomerase